jgi:hypothetical protein
MGLYNSMSNSQKSLMKVVYRILTAFIVLLSIWLLISSILTRQQTGELKINSPGSGSGIVVTQPNKNAVYVGSGSVAIHVKPGDYQVLAINNGKQSNATAKVIKGQVSSVVFGSLKSYLLPSADSIQFTGTNALLNNGLTVDQISNLKEAFFQFKKSAQTINIVPSSVEPGAHNANVDTSFTINFNVLIDSTSYKATIKYSGLDDTELLLYTPQNNTQVFDKIVVTSTGDKIYLTQRNNITYLNKVF